MFREAASWTVFPTGSNETMRDRAAIEALIDQWVQVEGFHQKPQLDAKIALLSLALEQLKHERRVPEELVGFEEFTQCQIFADTSKLVVAAPEFVQHLGTGTAAIQLQAPLLLFLLLHHQERFPVYDIIRLFIEKIRDQLEYLDFKRTKTGVTRCFTNTRFAAKVLRPTQVHEEGSLQDMGVVTGWLSRRSGYLPQEMLGQNSVGGSIT